MDSNGLIVISLLVTVAFLVVLNCICFVFACIQYRKRKNTINCISKDEALSSSINIQRNNFLDAREHLTCTPIQLTSGKSEFDVITNFQKLVEQEINEYFVPKIKECYSYIQQKDWLVLSVKWNTIETLFNIDNIQDYIREHIKNPGFKNNNKSIESFRETIKQSQFNELPNIIDEIRK